MLIDYMLVKNRYRSRVKDVKVIPGDETMSQHCPDVLFSKEVKKKKEFRM